MAYTDDTPFKLPRRLVFEGGVNIETITADKTMSLEDSIYQVITNNKGSSATVKLPVKEDGAVYWFKCTAASGHYFVIQDASGNPVIGGSGLGIGKSACIVSNGSNWAVLFQQA